MTKRKLSGTDTASIENVSDMADPPSAKKTRVNKDKMIAKKSYTSQQKAAIQQFQSFTQADKNTAVRHLKSHNWNQEAAVNGFFSGGGSAAASSGAKDSLNRIFDAYREDVKNSPDSVGVEGTMKYLGDIGVNIEGLDALAALEIVQAPAMGEISREGFVNGWLAANADSIDKQKSHIKALTKTLPSSLDTYTKVYKHTFQLAKTGNQKAVPLEMASAYWELLFTSPLSAVKWHTTSNPWAEWWIGYLNTEFKRSVNKDVWNQTLKFAQEALQDESLSFWNEESSSWPSVIDDFILWVKKEKRGGGVEDTMEE